MSRPPIRIVIADDHAMVRRSMSILIRAEPDLVLIGEATNGVEAVELCNSLLPDLVIMDIVMPISTGIDATRILHRAHPKIRVLGLTNSYDENRIQEMRDAGAVECLTKDISSSDLTNAIRAAAAS